MSKVKNLEVTFSIIITVFNDFKNFKSTYKSCINQIGLKDEIIIVDSSDNSLALEYINNNKQVSYYYQKPLGVFPAMNFGITKAQNNYIQIICSGDLMMPNTLSFVKEQILNNKQKNEIYVFAQLYKYDSNYSYVINPSNEILFPHQSVVCYKQVYKDSLYNESFVLTADQFFFADARKKYNIYFNNLLFTSYDMHGMSRVVSLTNSKDLYLLYKKLEKGVIKSIFYAFVLPYTRKVFEIIFGKKISFYIGFILKKQFIKEFSFK